MENQKTFAVLIDADNVSPERFERIFGEISLWGNATFRRIYGNWAEYNRSALKEKLVEFALTPVQQFNYIKGKNATDIAMVIDAMDILYTGKVDGFAIVTNDSDFTRLALRLRESGMTVIGMGDDVAPAAFRAACTDFIVLRESRRIAEELTEQKKLRLAARKPLRVAKFPHGASDKADEEKPAAEEELPAQTADAAEIEQNEAPAEEKRKVLSDRELRDAIREFLYGCTEDEGWFSASTMLNRLMQKFPDLDIKDYADLPLFAGKRKIWTTYFLSLGFLESKQKGPSNYCLRLKYEERRRLDAEKGQSKGAAVAAVAAAEPAKTEDNAVNVAVDAPAEKQSAEKQNSAAETAVQSGSGARKPSSRRRGRTGRAALELKVEVPAENRPELKTEAKAEVKAEEKAEAKAEPKVEAKAEVKAETKPEAKAEIKVEAKAEEKKEAATGARKSSSRRSAGAKKAELKAEPKAETKAEPKAETKTEAEPRTEAKTRRRSASGTRSAGSKAVKEKGPEQPATAVSAAPAAEEAKASGNSEKASGAKKRTTSSRRTKKE